MLVRSAIQENDKKSHSCAQVFPSDCCLVQLELEKNKPLFECFYFVILQLGCVRHLVVLMDSFFQSCLQRSNLLFFMLEGARQLVGLRCNFLQSSKRKKKKGGRLVSIWPKLTVQKKRQKLIESDLTSYSTLIHRFQIHLQETDLTIKKSKQQHCYTELLEKSGDDYPQEWPPCYRPKTVGKLPLQPKPGDLVT